MPPKTSLFEELSRGILYIDGKKISGITEVSIEPYEHQEINELGFSVPFQRNLYTADEIKFSIVPPSSMYQLAIWHIIASNNWLKMHGMPMRRKKTWQRKKERQKCIGQRKN